MKRIINIILIIVMVGICITGCEQTSANEEAQVVEVEFWNALGGSLGEGITSIVEEYNASQDKYNVKMVVNGSYDELNTSLQAAYAAKKTPALVAGYSGFDGYYNKGLVTPIEDYLPESYDKDDIVGGFMKGAVRDGKMIFAPAYGTSQVLYYNKAVLEESGHTVDDFATWQSLAAMSSDVVGTDTNQDEIAYVWEPMSGMWNMIDAGYSNGATFFSEDLTQVTFNSPEMIEVLEQFRVWINEDEIMKIHYGGQGWEYWYKTMDDWVYGKSLGYTGSPGDYVIALDAVNASVESGVKNEFAVTHQPGWGDNDPAILASAINYMIPNSANLTEEQKLGAADFVNFATNTVNTAKFSMSTGYVAVRNSALDDPDYKMFLENNPDADAALKQIDAYGVPEFTDPTGGACLDAFTEAVEKIQIENMDVETCLQEAEEKAQEALDKYNGK